MSITASYQRLSAEAFQELCDDPDKADTYFGYNLDDEAIDGVYSALEASERYLDIETDWQALHFLLTGKAEMDRTEVPPPLGNVVLGGTDTPWEATYNQVRFLTPQEVREVAAALEQIDVEDLRGRFDPAAFRAARIYPGSTDWKDPEEITSLLDTFDKVRGFFSAAARAGEVVLLSAD